MVSGASFGAVEENVGREGKFEEQLWSQGRAQEVLLVELTRASPISSPPLTFCALEVSTLAPEKLELALLTINFTM